MLLASHVFLSLGYHFLLAVSKDPYGQQQTQAVTMSIPVILTTFACDSQVLPSGLGGYWPRPPWLRMRDMTSWLSGSHLAEDGFLEMGDAVKCKS